MKLLVDTDVFCKLGIAGLLPEAVGILGADLPACGRLRALPHMLRRGSLRNHYGAVACDALMPLAEAMPPVQRPGAIWLDALASISAVDPGEVQLFAAAADFGLVVVSGDKRALRAMKNVSGLSEALAGHVVVLEAILLALCERLGPEELRRRVIPVAASDTMLTACFSPGNLDLRGGLQSYYRDIVADVAPLVLWNPQSGDKT